VATIQILWPESPDKLRAVVTIGKLVANKRDEGAELLTS